MVLSNVSMALDRYLRNVTCLKYNGETLGTNGEVTMGLYVSSTKSMAVLPISQKELKYYLMGFMMYLIEKHTQKILLTYSLTNQFCKPTLVILKSYLRITDIMRLGLLDTYCKKVQP